MGTKFSLKSEFHPPKSKDLSKWSMWYRDVVGYAADLGVRRVPQVFYRQLFNEGLTPREAAARVKNLC